MSIVPLTEEEVAGLVAAVESSMLDTCLIGIYAEESGDLGEPVVTYTDGRPVPCRFRERNSEFKPAPDYDVVTVNATLRLPLGTVISCLDRVTITHRFGKRLDTPMGYGVSGDPVAGIADLQVSLEAAHL